VSLDEEIDTLVDTEIPKEIEDMIIDRLLSIVRKLRDKSIDPSLSDIIIQHILDSLTVSWMYNTYTRLVQMSESGKYPELEWLFLEGKGE